MALTSDNLPGAAVRATRDDPYPNVEARPLQLPDFVNLKPKNPAVSLRWVNRVAGEGMRFDEMSFAGFVPVKPDEVVMPNGAACLPSFVRDGKVIRGDLICMKIAKNIYEGALKNNFNRATSRLHSSTQLRTGQSEVNKALSERGAPADVRSKVAAYVPNEKELQRDFPEGSENPKNLQLGSERREDK